MENKKTILMTVILVIAIIVIAVMAFNNYKLSDSKKQLQNELDSLKNQVVSIQSTEKNEKEQVEELVKGYINYINVKDWANVEKYTDKDVVEILKTYEISNMSISDYSNYQYINDSHCYFVSFDYNTNKIESLKDVGIGKILTVKKENGSFKINPICTAP